MESISILYHCIPNPPNGIELKFQSIGLFVVNINLFTEIRYYNILKTFINLLTSLTRFIVNKKIIFGIRLYPIRVYF